MTFVDVAKLSYFHLHPLTLLHQIDVLLLVYAFQTAPTAAAAKVIRSVKNLYIILKILKNN